MRRVVFLLPVVWMLLAGPAQGGAGVSRLAIFDPQTGSGGTSDTASAVATAFQAEFQRLMDEHEVWGIELLARDTATSAAEHAFGSRAPRWEGDYTPEWVRLLNTKDGIAYAALGKLGEGAGQGGSPAVQYELRDMILNHRIIALSVSGKSPAEAGRDLAHDTLAALQLYLAEVTEVGNNRALINVGPEALSTGTLLTVYAHAHLGPHPSGYAPHGHREEDDHLLGSRVYALYRDLPPTSASLHTHSRSRWRALLRGYPPAFEHLPTTATTAAAPSAALLAARAPQAPNPLDMAITPTAEDLRLLNLAHEKSGRPTGVLRITGFVKPHRFFNSYYAIAEVVEGFATPGSFLKMKP